MTGIVLPPPECPSGYPLDQLEACLDEQQYRRLSLWMRGQTMSICDGRRYNHEAQEYEPTECADHPHGPVVYSWDVDRWLKGGPIVD